jgi:hypothetical protein
MFSWSRKLACYAYHAYPTGGSHVANKAKLTPQEVIPGMPSFSRVAIFIKNPKLCCQEIHHKKTHPNRASSFIKLKTKKYSQVKHMPEHGIQTQASFFFFFGTQRSNFTSEAKETRGPATPAIFGRGRNSSFFPSCQTLLHSICNHVVKCKKSMEKLFICVNK